MTGQKQSASTPYIASTALPSANVIVLHRRTTDQQDLVHHGRVETPEHPIFLGCNKNIGAISCRKFIKQAATHGVRTRR
jgi:hypothetical protein